MLTIRTTLSFSWFWTPDQGCFVLVAGRAADIWGRKRVFTIGIAIAAVTTLIAGFMKNQIAFCIFRALTGIGGALVASSNIGQTGFFPLRATVYSLNHGAFLKVSWLRTRGPGDCARCRLGCVSLGCRSAVPSGSPQRHPWRLLLRECVTAEVASLPLIASYHSAGERSCGSMLGCISSLSPASSFSPSISERQAKIMIEGSTGSVERSSLPEPCFSSSAYRKLSLNHKDLAHHVSELRCPPPAAST